MAGKITGPTGQAAVTVLLTGHNVPITVPFKELCVDSAAVRSSQRSSFCSGRQKLIITGQSDAQPSTGHLRTPKVLGTHTEDRERIRDKGRNQEW